MTVALDRILSSGKFLPTERLKADNDAQAQIHRANDMLAAELGTDNRVVADSGHTMMLYSPAGGGPGHRRHRCEGAVIRAARLVCSPVFPTWDSNLVTQ